MPKKSTKRSPKAGVLTIDGNWKGAVRGSFQATKPAGGWPKAGK